MPTRLALLHQTDYQYDRPVYLSPHLVRLRPAAHSRVSLDTYALAIEPASQVTHWQQDPFGNFLARVDFTGTLTHLSVRVEMTVTLTPVNPFDFYLNSEAQAFPFTYEPTLAHALSPYLDATPPSPVLAGWLDRIDRRSQPTTDFLTTLNRQVFADVAYTTRLEPGVQTPDETLTLALGSCRDSAWLLVQVLRCLGLAARFVSGYLVQLAATPGPDGNTDGPATDTLSLHAWAEVYVPGAGWIGLDPTSGLLTAEGHLPLACTTEPGGAAPISGTAGLSNTTLTYQSTVTRLS
ncbi:hypothetical protein GCM10027578_32270 [Spirosoma luteolum]